jgi:predicted dehydrogenase
MKPIKRRSFLKKTAALMGSAASVPYIIPSSAMGLWGHIAPSDRLTVANIGCGSRGLYNLGHFLKFSEVQCLAVADCWDSLSEKGKNMVDAHYGNKDCKILKHNEILDRKDIDAVLIATGDRWHAVLSILASRAGKDVYCEKPFCLTIGEGQALVETTKKNGTVWQCGTQRRSNKSFEFFAKSPQSGKIGRLHTITLGLGGWDWEKNEPAIPAPVPEGFDYDRWLGQAPWLPYSEQCVRMWRSHWNTGGGVVADMGPHFIDIAQWAHESEHTTAVEYEGCGEFREGGYANVPFVIDIEARYSDGVVIKMNSGEKGIRFDGDEGWIYIDDFGNITPKELLSDPSISGVSYRYMAGHIRNFLDCVRSRQQPVSGPEITQRSHTIAHCANLSVRLGRKLQWDPEKERFINDEEANGMLVRPMREPWGI